MTSWHIRRTCILPAIALAIFTWLSAYGHSDVAQAKSEKPINLSNHALMQIIHTAQPSNGEIKNPSKTDHLSLCLHEHDIVVANASFDFRQGTATGNQVEVRLKVKGEVEDMFVQSSGPTRLIFSGGINGIYPIHLSAIFTAIKSGCADFATHFSMAEGRTNVADYGRYYMHLTHYGKRR